MSLKQKLRDNVAASIKQGNALERNLLRTVIGEVQRKEAKVELTDEQVVAVIKKMRASNLETMEKLGAGTVGAERLAEENVILEDYIPKTMSVEQIAEALREICTKLVGAPNDGPATGMAVGFLKKQGLTAEGKDVVQVVKKMRE